MWHRSSLCRSHSLRGGVHSSPAIAFDLNGEFLYVAGGSNGAQKHKVRPLT